jgi:signal transduction histidine kinase
MRVSVEKRTASELQDRVTELIEQRRAISEVLRAVANSPHDLQPIFETILDSARHLCRADAGVLRLIEKEGHRLVAQKVRKYSPPTILEHGSYLGRLIASGTLVHVPDALALEPFREGELSVVAAAKGGVRSALYVPMLRNNDAIGALGIWRERVEPFTDTQIELVTDFAAQATIALEITRRERQFREVQDELAHANRVAAMGQLTATIAHELRQPLSAVLNDGKASLNWLTRHPPEVEEAKLCLEEVINDANRASDVIDRVCHLVKKDTLRMEKLNINGAILEVINLIRSEVIKNGVTVRTDLAESLPYIRGDRIQLQQVILNLLINAIQAMGDLAEGEREMHVSTSLIQSEGVRVSVRDTSLGFSPEILENLFVPFYTTKLGGMGMGMSICESIIADHGGRLWATRAEPRGALFQFTIPAD